MAKVGRPFLNASRQRVEIINDADKTMSTTGGDSLTTGESTSLESGETYIIQTAKTSSERVITLPPASKGAYVRILWGISESGVDTKIICHDTTNEGLKGWTPFFHSSGAADSRDIAAAAMVFAANGSEDFIIVEKNITEGCMLSFISDGTYWYTMGGAVIATNVLTNGST